MALRRRRFSSSNCLYRFFENVLAGTYFAMLEPTARFPAAKRIRTKHQNLARTDVSFVAFVELVTSCPTAHAYFGYGIAGHALLCSIFLIDVVLATPRSLLVFFLRAHRHW